MLALLNTGSIHPELQEASPWLRETVAVSETMMNQGINPGTALAVAASVPIVLRILKMVNEFTNAWLEDWRAGNKIKREAERLQLLGEQSLHHPNGKPPP